LNGRIGELEDGICIFSSRFAQVTSACRNSSRNAGFDKFEAVFASKESVMRFWTIGKRKTAFLAAAILLGGLMLAGCNEYVQIIRNRDIPVLKHQTWAWRPAAARREAREERPVISRDVIGGRQPVQPIAPEPNPANEAVRQELRTAIERQLTEKGLTQVSDPAVADFLVDYHYAMRGRNVTVERVYPGAYPGLVCGPFGCWQGWGYGPPEVSYENVRFREGTFVLDVLKRTPIQLAYRATGVEPPHHGTFTNDQIHDMVHALLKGLKPKG
jgi:Domain of unknown function (DUF4136)